MGARVEAEKARAGPLRAGWLVSGLRIASVGGLQRRHPALFSVCEGLWRANTVSLSLEV
jgi:hypothetical protein